MTIQSRSREDYLDTIQLLRKSQLDSLNNSGKSKVFWPERDMAYEVYVTHIPVVHKLGDVAPQMNLTFGIITGLINTETGAVTGDDGSDYIMGEELGSRPSDEGDFKFDTPGKGHQVL